MPDARILSVQPTSLSLPPPPPPVIDIADDDHIDRGPFDTGTNVPCDFVRSGLIVLVASAALENDKTNFGVELNLGSSFSLDRFWDWNSIIRFGFTDITFWDCQNSVDMTFKRMKG